MDEATRKRLVELALSIEKFRSLPTYEQEWLFPLLSRGIRGTLEMLDTIADEKLTFEEIARELGKSPITVSQRLNALLQGGMALDMTGTAAYAPTGRPRKLARR